MLTGRLPGARGVPHRAVAGVDADVERRGAEEHQVTRLRVGHRGGRRPLGLGGAGQAPAEPSRRPTGCIPSSRTRTAWCRRRRRGYRPGSPRSPGRRTKREPTEPAEPERGPAQPGRDAPALRRRRGARTVAVGVVARRGARTGQAAAVRGAARLGDGALDARDRLGQDDRRRRGLRPGLDDAGEPDLPEGRRDHGGTGGRGGRDGHGVERGRRSGRGRGGGATAGLACLLSDDADAGRLNEATRPPETASAAEILPIGLAERETADDSAETGLGAPGARWRPGVGLGTCMDLSRRLRGELSGSGGRYAPGPRANRLGTQRCPAADLRVGFTPRSVVRRPGSGSPAPAKRMCELSGAW